MTAIADKHEISATAKVQSELFDGVFGAQALLPGSDSEIDCMRALKNMQPLLFTHTHPMSPSGQCGISIKDAAKLWCKPLNNMKILLRSSKNNFENVTEQYSSGPKYITKSNQLCFPPMSL